MRMKFLKLLVLGFVVYVGAIMVIHRNDPPAQKPKFQPPTRENISTNFTSPLYTKSSALVCPERLLFDQREGHGMAEAVQAHLSLWDHETKVEQLGCQELKEGLPISLTSEGMKDAADWESNHKCAMVEFENGYIFSCDLHN